MNCEGRRTNKCKKFTISYKSKKCDATSCKETYQQHTKRLKSGGYIFTVVILLTTVNIWEGRVVRLVWEETEGLTA